MYWCATVCVVCVCVCGHNPTSKRVHQHLNTSQGVGVFFLSFFLHKVVCVILLHKVVCVILLLKVMRRLNYQAYSASVVSRCGYI